MKHSDQPTEYVLIQTLIKGNWAPCHFAVLHLTEPWVFVMNQRLKTLEPFRKDKTFYSVTYWDEPMGYYVCEEEDETGQLLLDMYADDISWCFISLDDPEEYLNWRLPVNRTETHMLMINPDSSSSYMCFSRVSEYEIATEMFSLKEVLGIIGTCDIF
jgi:hypothetical protein